MRIFVSLILTFYCNFIWGQCAFKNDVSKVVSLSGPVTTTLNQLGLLKDPKVLGISTFHPISSGEFKGRRYPGGVFLSRNTLDELKGALIFFDEGRELKKVLTSNPSIESFEIKTRNLLPTEVVDVTLRSLEKYISGCDKKIEEFKTVITSTQIQLLKNVPEKFKAVFYLGDFAKGRAPELVIANDGVVKFLKVEKKIQTYPSDLPYVNWSAKVMNTLPKEMLHIGIVDSGAEGKSEIKKSSLGMTLIYPGALVPGESQLRAFLFLFMFLNH